ncbi:alcohol dehydrogenase catalytic domain-containing protein [Streptomyces sp. JJ38]|uniref:alcohol dehydrogenase catalytic domain-containing protein n=1 Tax=Streptomyces sp. JJ38 TaxID=2738128 RepID=UPI0027E1351A|nr:alcohol dehydrogenase catalytic domain-containing protein [Streptomyces sp. JJ38]
MSPPVRTARAVVVDKPGAHRLVSGPVAEPAFGEVRIAVTAALVNTADRALYAGTAAGWPDPYPVTPGGEWSGTVEAIGEGVAAGLLGRKAVGERAPGGCLACARCREDEPHLCSEPSGRPGAGAFADVLNLPARLLHVLPDDADLRAAALLGRAAVAATAVLAAMPVPGERAAVVGAGPLGLLTVQLLAASAPRELVAVDPRALAGERALALGADRAACPSEAAELYGRCDLVVETAGEAESAFDACLLARRGGRVLLAAPPEPGGARGLDPARLLEQALTVRCTPGATSAAWAHAVRAFRLGRLSSAPLVSHEFGLADFDAAMETATARAPGTGAVLLRP